MAYAQSSVTTKQSVVNGRRHWHVVFTETEVGTSDTATITGLPTRGTITLVRVDPAFTTGTTVQPAFGRVSNWTAAGTDINHIGQIASAAGSINDGSNLRYSGLVDGKLYYRSIADAGADTTTTVEITVVEGHI